MQALVRVAAAQGARDASGLDSALREAREAVDSGELETENVEEALLQSYLFLGFPAALDALGRWRRISGRPAPPAGDVDLPLWEDRGPRVCRKVYGDQLDALRANIARLHPDLSVWMVAEGYGKVLGREGLELRDREILIAVLLAVQDAPTQLHSHLRGALRNGVAPAELEAMLTEADPWIPGGGARDRAWTTWSRVLAAWEGRRRSRSGPTGGPGAPGSDERGRSQETATSDNDEAGHVH